MFKLSDFCLENSEEQVSNEYGIVHAIAFMYGWVKY